MTKNRETHSKTVRVIRSGYALEGMDFPQIGILPSCKYPEVTWKSNGQIFFETHWKLCCKVVKEQKVKLCFHPFS